MFIKIGNWFGFLIVFNEKVKVNNIDVFGSDFRVILTEEDKRVMRR